MTRRRRPRRGVLLLVVLSILVLFVLTGMTFIVIANHYQQTSRDAARHATTGDSPRSLTDRVVHQLLRGTTNRDSALFSESLLADLYGNDGFRGRIDRMLGQPQAKRQFQAFRYRVNVQPNRLDNPASIVRPVHYYDGCVITMITGPAAGLSSRIVKFEPDDRTGVNWVSGNLVVEAFANDSKRPLFPQSSDLFVVNGLPFNGTGKGFNAATGRLDLPGDAGPLALFPNANRTSSGIEAGVGGMDESYDAVDFQNMFLARIPPGIAVRFNRIGGEVEDTIIPSFHRPALIRYWVERLQQLGASVPPQVLRQIISKVVMRPTQLEHPEFTGSNASRGYQFPVPLTGGPVELNQLSAFFSSLIDGPFDVDNDNDSIPDSVWIDLGLPVSMTDDGRVYRPLVAILCQDLDGRLNLNVHGSLDSQSANIGGQSNMSVTDDRIAGGPTASVGRGSGYGPAEISLVSAFADSGFSQAEAFQLVAARYADQRVSNQTLATLVPGIANQQLAASAIRGSALLSADMPANQLPDERFSFFKQRGMPSDFRRQPLLYGSPPDLKGRGSVLLDHSGHPIYFYSDRFGVVIDNLGNIVSRPQDADSIDDPYEVNLLSPTAFDTNYSLTELERILRSNDFDVRSLPDRLIRMAPTAFGDTNVAQRLKRLVTTRSFDIPVPSATFVSDRRGTPSFSFVEYVSKRLIRGGVLASELQIELEKMLPFEVLRGHKMDLNRLLGNGQDDDSDRLVDEPDEVAWEERNQTVDGYPPPDYANDRPIPRADSDVKDFGRSRHLYARNLYCLLRFLVDDRYREPTSENLGVPQVRELTSRRLAQWCVNVVDFRDRDAIMTPFEYDANPMNGWDVDGDPRTVEGADRRLVWGMEYPDLLMTETAAFHDRRVKDTNHDTNTGPEGEVQYKERGDSEMAEDASEVDADLDQYRIPEGSLFIELYCTRPRYENNPAFPEELYTVDHANRSAALDLGRMSVEQGVGNVRYPVWRIAISEPHLNDREGGSNFWQLRNSNPDTASFDARDTTIDLPPAATHDPVQLDRVIWLGNRPENVPPAPRTPESGYVYWNRARVAPLLEPDRYAIVGPREATVIGSVRGTDGDNAPSSQRIILTGTNLQRSFYANAGGAQPLPQPVLPIVCRANNSNPELPTVGVSVSEPLPGPNYYPAPLDPITGLYDDEDTPQNRFPDVPLDSRDTAPLARLGLLDTATTPPQVGFCTAYLQRLANPLLGWNPEPGRQGHNTELPVNPYITVDWQSIDLTVVQR